MRSSGWDHAVLITQWEVARKRAGVGGATQLTAQWWPWYEFTLDRRIPAAAFSPRPSVDGGLFTITRRTDPLVPAEERKQYQSWVAQVFGGRGRGLSQILRRAGVAPTSAESISRRLPLRRAPLPRDMSAQLWAEAWQSRRR